MKNIKSVRFWLSCLVVLYFISTVFIIPFVVKSQLITYLDENLSHKASLEKVSFNPFGFEIQLYNFKLYDKKNDLLIDFENIRVDFNLIKTAYTQKINFDAITLYKPTINVKLLKNGKINLLDLVPEEKQVNSKDEKNESVSKEKVLPEINFSKIILEEVEILFTDLTVDKPFKVAIYPLNYTILNLSTKLEKKGEYNLDLSINSHTKLTSKGLISLNPLQMNGDISLSKLQLGDFWTRVEKDFKFNINNTLVDFSTNYDISLVDKIFDFKLNNANAKISDFSLTSKDSNKKILSFDNINTSLNSFDLRSQTVEINSILLQNIFADFVMNKDKTNNISTIFASKEKTNISKEEKADTKEWNVGIKNVDLKNSTITFIDNTIESSFTTSLNNINLNVQNIDLKPNTKFVYDFNTLIHKNTKFMTNGELSIKPLSLNSKYSLEKLPLNIFQPYLNESLNIKLLNADLSTKGTFELEEKTNYITVNTSSEINSINIKQNNSKESLIKVSKIKINKLRYIQEKNSLNIASIDLYKPYAKVHISKNKKTNFDNLVKKTDKKTTEKSTEKTKKSKEFVFDLGPVIIKNGSTNFTDLSLPLPFQSLIDTLNGKVSHVSSHSSKPSSIKLDGTIDKYGLAKINGSLDYKNIKENTKMNLLFKNIDTKNLTPYSSEFIGRKIDGGKLTLDLKYKLISSQLDAKNKIIIHKIQLGEVLKGENSSDLPIDLAIALLEDSDGIIDLELPITGDVDSPEFHIGSIVGKVITNLIVKIVSSPFSFLGSLLGVEADDIKFVDFEAGESKLLPPSKESLDLLVKVFKKRPNIALELNKTYHKGIDTKAIKISKFETKLNNKIKELKKINKDKKLDTYLVALESIYIKTESKDKLEKHKKTFFKKVKDSLIFKKTVLEKTKYLNSLKQIQINKETVMARELELLATARANMISSYLQDTHKIEAKRIVVKDIEVLDDEQDNEWIKSELGITVKQK